MTVTIDDITTHTSTAVVLIRGSGFTAAQASAMRADMDTFLATTVPETIGDLADVDETGAATGMALIRNAANDGYVLGQAAGSLDTVSSGGVVAETDVTEINFTSGLEVVSGTLGDGKINVLPTYAGTGSRNTVAHSDHTHTTPTTDPVPYTSKGTLSSGSVTLVTTNVNLPAATSGEPKVYRVKVVLNDTERGNGGSSYYTQAITIGTGTGATRTSIERQCVGGVPRSVQHTHAREITGTGTDITISAAITYVSGDPLTVDAGEIVIDVACNR